MTPQQVVLILWRRGWVVVLTSLSTMIGAGGVMWLVPPRYDAAATASSIPDRRIRSPGSLMGGAPHPQAWSRVIW
jgi:uncharacterized protein involved in exopolysaccharide biosynthesis